MGTSKIQRLRSEKSEFLYGKLKIIWKITFADSGCGLEAGTADKIFLPTFSTKRNEQGEIIGTGLGIDNCKGFR